MTGSESAAIDRARDVIQQEVVALEQLSAGLDHRFLAAVQLIATAPGKCVLTGMGKAGLIAQKISATLRSTGTSSVFLDPAQALHGDMGLLAFGDVLVALSNSGETDEVMCCTRYAQQHRIEVVGITACPDSPLGIEADVLVPYPRLHEGCPIGRAPMASTAMMLALGDAIAACLMARIGFTERDFLALHHGGYLGRAIAATK